MNLRLVAVSLLLVSLVATVALTGCRKKDKDAGAPTEQAPAEQAATPPADQAAAPTEPAPADQAAAPAEPAAAEPAAAAPAEEHAAEKH